MYNNFEISLVVFMPNITTNHAVAYNNNNNDDNNNNGNFICVFECTMVNLATYRQFTNAA